MRVWASHTPSTVNFEVVSVLCTVIVMVCYFLVLPYSCWRFLWCFVGTMADDDEDDPNRLWYVYCLPADEDKFMICYNCCHEWYHGECVGISVSQEDVISRDNENMCALYAFNLPMISLFGGLFQSIPLLLFSGNPALVLNFVTLHLMYMMNCTMETKHV